MSAETTTETAETGTPGRTFDITGQIVIHATVPGKTARDAVKMFLLQEPDAQPVMVGSREIMGICENTGTPILIGDTYTTDDDGVMVLTGQVDTEEENEAVFADDEETDEAGQD